VPWLIMVASIHTMISYKNSETALKVSIILNITVFILILYSTFLTRSGILGDSSVHSFTDLGLSGQLLLYLMFFLVMAIAISAIRWKEIPTSEKEAEIYSREFWIFIGVTVLTLMGFQVFLGISIPVFNAILKSVGIDSNFAPPADQIKFYSQSQLWFAVVVALLSAVGQFFWWKKIDRKVLLNELFVPVVATLLVVAILVNVGKVYDLSLAAMLLAGTFTVLANGKILFSLLKASPALSGGAIAHIGAGLMLIGIMASAGYSRVVSLNNTGMHISRSLSDEYNREHLLLFVNEPRTMAGYKIEYKGERLEPRGKFGYINPNDIEGTDSPFKVVAKRDIIYNEEKLYSAQDSIQIYPENIYYELELTDASGKIHKLFPRVQDNPTMGQAPSPDIKRDFTKDLYAHVDRRFSREDAEWDTTYDARVRLNEQFFANDYVSVVENIERVTSVNGVALDSNAVAVKATIRVKGEYQEYVAEPHFVIYNGMPGLIPAEIRDLGLLFRLSNIHPETGQFTISVSTRQKDWIVIRALEKPFINILWLGTFVLMIGFTVAGRRRFTDFRKMKAKGQEI
jgi:cytochrome c-type biogenesis protein CcmF